MDGGEDATIDGDILEGDYQNEDAERGADGDDVEMPYIKQEDNDAVDYSLNQSPLD